jgi:uncharacterized protein (DUF488 family)
MQLDGQIDSAIYTIGHSNQPLASFLSLLAQYGITAVADVRSYPRSKTNPQFDQNSLKKELEEHHTTYVFLGKELGARSENADCYKDRRVQYESLARTESFKEGLRRLRRGMQKYRVALMCAEAEPLDCHRAILISRYLRDLDIPVKHILKDGRLEDHELSMDRLLRTLNIHENLVLRTKAELIAEGYRVQGDRIAYELPKAEDPKLQRKSVAKAR